MEQIQGLTYQDDFLTVEEEVFLMEQIDKSVWLQDLKRRVQHYGYKYSYKSRRIDASMKVEDLPQWVEFVCKRLVEKNYFEYIPDQLIINEYIAGQGIASHIDCIPCFGGVVASISLNSRVLMNFSNKEREIPIQLKERSLVVLKDAARYNWKHGIKARKTDKIGEISIRRGRRISLTFRKVILK